MITHVTPPQLSFHTSQTAGTSDIKDNQRTPQAHPQPPQPQTKTVSEYALENAGWGLKDG